jgi:phosphomannomutase
LRARYFISSEINSEVADQEAKMEELAGDIRTARSPGWTVSPSTATTGTSNTEPLLRLNLESLVSLEHMEKR